MFLIEKSRQSAEGFGHSENLLSNSISAIFNLE